MRNTSLLTAFVAMTAGAVSTAVSGFSPLQVPMASQAPCASCHTNHGGAGPQLLRAESNGLCLECHEGSGWIGRPGLLRWIPDSTKAARIDLGPDFDKPYTHLRSSSCSDCHSVHRRSDQLLWLARNQQAGDGSKPPTKRGFADENAVCLSCHSVEGTGDTTGEDIARLVRPSSRSFHPLIEPTREPAGSLRANSRSGVLINCTDCHSNNDPQGARGPHGSTFEGLLRARLAMTDDTEESAESYALCYDCHKRRVVLDEDGFPLHRLHVEGQRVSCISCHDPHGSRSARSMIRFGETLAGGAVLASASGRLEFVSEIAGSGACYLSCHGVNHDPLGYGPEFDESGLSLMAISDESFIHDPLGTGVLGGEGLSLEPGGLGDRSGLRDSPKERRPPPPE